MTGHRFKPEKAEKLLNPKRKILLPPEKVVEMLDIQKSDIIADLGAGNGYLTIPLAKETNETVFAVDIEPKMLEMLKVRADKEDFQNIQYIQSDLENIQLIDHSVNKAVLAFVMHEISDMKKAIGEFKRILKPGGRLVILEWEAVESMMGPPLHERISSNAMKQLLLENGFHSKIIPLHEAFYAVTVDMN